MTKESIADIVVSGGSVQLGTRSKNLSIADASDIIHSRKKAGAKKYQVYYLAPEGDKTAEALNGVALKAKRKAKEKGEQMKGFTYPDESHYNVFSHLYDDIDVAADKFMLIYQLEFNKKS